MSKSLAFLPLLFLTACGGERVAVVKPPVELTTCADEPAAPALPIVDWSSVETARPIQAMRDAMTLSYVLAMRSAWGDCKSRVDGVKAWSEDRN